MPQCIIHQVELLVAFHSDYKDNKVLCNYSTASRRHKKVVVMQKSIEKSFPGAIGGEVRNENFWKF